MVPPGLFGETQKIMTQRIITALFASTLLVACGGDVESPEDARAGWAKTSAALASGGAAAQGGAGGAAAEDDTSFRAGGVDIAVNVDAPCQDGGSIAISGTYNVNTDAGAQVEFAYDTEFKKCKVDGLRIDGDLAYDLSVVTTDTSSSVVYAYQGEIKWSGEIKGSCVIDMTGSVMTSTGSASVEYKGSVCGYDASATLNVNVGG